ncbi:Ig-like domain-containing protein [Vibrio atlanticus]|uniref:Uncharacterized protein n=1 Tax=Vibrio atlanticus (strain LGP32) TaxID=575788 RepID=B7VKP8_VIBA3|nr:Ig-like domain-containing protein [Vibrio atlanticus]CAV19927.1 Hypothetical protein VS_2675 [Vibrio atlanticus]
MKKTLLLICMLMLLSGCGGGGAEGKATDNTQVGSGGSGGGAGSGSGGSGESGSGDGSGSGGSGGSGGGDSSGSGSSGESGGGAGSGSGGSGGSGGGDGSGSGGSGGSGGGDGSGSGGSGGGQVKPTLDKYETLPQTFSADVTRNGHTVKIEVSKYSVRRADTEFYYYDASKSSSLIAFDYTPEVRSYRGQIVGEPSSQVIGYVDSKNQFYGFVFYGEDKAWIVENLPVPNLNNIAQKKLDKDLHRSPAELVAVENNYQLPGPSLKSPVPARSLMKLQMSSIGYLVDIESFETSFNKNIIDTIAAMDHTTNSLDYFFARDALIRVDYPIGVITINSGGKTASELSPILDPLVRSESPSEFQIGQTFFKEGKRCNASGLSSRCDFHPDLAHTLHEIGHTFSLGHHVGPETSTLMSFSFAIDTNMISTMKTSSAIDQRLAPAMESRMNPKANIDHIGTTRNTPVIVDVLENDFDANGINVGGELSLDSYTKLSQKGGVIELQAGKLKYTPVEGYVGEDHFGYTITDDTGLKDSSEVHVSVKSNARVLYLSDNHFTIRQDIKNHGKHSQPNFKHMVNRAGKEMFFGKPAVAAYPNVGFHQYVIDQTSTNTPGAQTEPTFSENNLMTLQKHMPHDLAPGKQSFTVVTRYKQDGFYRTVPDNKGIHEMSLFSSGKIDDGFALSHFNGNYHRTGEPEKGLGWTLVSRQMYTRTSFSNSPHIIHAFAKPDEANIANNVWHSVAWVIDRENNQVSTWVDGNLVPMALSTDPTNFLDYIPLPAGFEGVYPGGTHAWIDSSWDASTEGYGPWFMNTNGQNRGSGADEIWQSFTRFISDKFAADDVQIYTYALEGQEIKNIANNKEKAFTNNPVNGGSQSFSQPIALTWDSQHATAYKLHWGYSSAMINAVSEQSTKSFQIGSPDATQKALYWRVDSKHGSEWIEGNVWSITNTNVVGEALALAFTKDEITGSGFGSDNDPWPKNSNKVIDGVHVVVAGQTRDNDASILRLSNDTTITLTDNNNRPFKQIRFSAAQWISGTEGYLQAEYYNSTDWVPLIKLNKGGVASGYGFGELRSSFIGIGSTSDRSSHPDWYDPASVDASAYYTIDLPVNTTEVRFKFYSTGNALNQVAIDQLNLYR